MSKRICFSLIISLAAVVAAAQLPPVFDADSLSVRHDGLKREYIAPRRVVWQQGSVGRTSVLMTLGSGQPDVARSPYCLMTSKNDTASLVLDYGRELHGGLKLVVGGAREASQMMRVRFGESVSEVMAEPDGGKNRKGFATNDHATRDFTLLIPRYGQIELGSTGFRFVRIDLLPSASAGEKGSYVQLCEASAIFRYRDLPYMGSFRSSDPRLDSIWLTGAYTVHLNMQEYLWDGVKRDRLVWLGDMHPEVATIMSVFGQNDVVERSLDLACQQYPLPAWINGMSSYSLWYLIIQHDWLLHGGDRTFLERHRPYIMGLIDKIDGRVDADGTEHLTGIPDGKEGGRFLDWPSSPNKKGVEAGYRALIVWAINDAERLCQVLGDKVRADKCRDIAGRIKKKTLPDNGLKQAAALMAIAGLEDARQACDSVITPGGAHGFSTFYGYYMLQALAMAGDYQQAIDIIRQYWGAMLDLGATSFWEDFDINWAKNATRIDEMPASGKADVHRDYGSYCYLSYRHSLCHGWASGPTAWLTRHVLGIEVVDEGCKKIRIRPHLGDLQWAEGTFPTPLGTVSVRHERSTNGKVITTVNAPKGVKIVK